MRSLILLWGGKDPSSRNRKVNWMLNLSTGVLEVVLSQALSLGDMEEALPGLEGPGESRTGRPADSCRSSAAISLHATKVLPSNGQENN